MRDVESVTVKSGQQKQSTDFCRGSEWQKKKMVVGRGGVGVGGGGEGDRLEFKHLTSALRQKQAVQWMCVVQYPNRKVIGVTNPRHLRRPLNSSVTACCTRFR